MHPVHRSPLCNIKAHPAPVTFVRQANVAHGPQQVNSGVQPTADQGPHPEKPENRPNEVLEHQYGERLEPGTAQAAVGTDPALAPMGEVHGTANGGGQAKLGS